MTSEILQMTYCHFREIVLFTWNTVFILFNAQQLQINQKFIDDIENNPGPTYVVDKAVLGIQYVCDSLHASCWSKVKKAFREE